MPSDLTSQLEHQKRDLSRRVFAAADRPGFPVNPASRPPLDPLLAKALGRAFSQTPAGKLEALRMEVDLLRRGLHALSSEIAHRTFGVVHVVTPVKVDDKTVFLLDSGPLKSGPWQTKEKATLAKFCGFPPERLPRDLDEAMVFTPEQIGIIERLQEEHAARLQESLTREPPAPSPAALPSVSGAELDLLQPGFADHLAMLFQTLLGEVNRLTDSADEAARARMALAARRGTHLVEQLQRLGAETRKTIEAVSVHTLVQHWTGKISGGDPRLRFELKLKATHEVLETNPHGLNHLLYTLLAGVADGLADRQALIAVGSRDTELQGVPHLHLEIRDSGGFATFAGVDPALDRDLLDEQNEVADEFADWAGIAQRSHARLRLHSEEGVVTRVEVFLPLTPGGDDSAETNSPRVWLVEEDDREAENITRMLHEFGARVERLHSGAELQEHFASATAPPDMVILEVLLSDTRGTVLRTWLYEQDPDLPVVLISGFSVTHPGVASVSNLPSTLYLQKPFDGQALLDMLRMTFIDTLPG